MERQARALVVPLALLIAAALGPPAADASARLTVTPEDPDRLEEVTLVLDASWRDGCVPVLDRPEIVDRTIFLEALHWIEGGCPSAVTAYGRAFELGKLEPGRWTAHYLLTTTGDDSTDPVPSTALAATLEFEVVEPPGPPATGRLDFDPLTPFEDGQVSISLAGWWSDSCTPSVVRQEARATAPGEDLGGVLEIFAQGSRDDCEPYRSRWEETLPVPFTPRPGGPWTVVVHVEDSAFADPGATFVWAERRFLARPSGVTPRLPAVSAVELDWSGSGTDPVLDVGLIPECDARLSTGPVEIALYGRPPDDSDPSEEDVIGLLSATFVAEDTTAEPGCQPVEVRFPQTIELPEPGRFRVIVELDDRRAGAASAGGTFLAEDTFDLAEPPGSRTLLDSRFRISVTWRDYEGNEGFAEAAEGQSGRSTIFAFFEPTNWEMLVKVLDGCALNDRFWVFASASTDVEYALRVEDRWSGQVKVYENELGEAADAITDSDAFATCAITATDEEVQP